MLGQQRGASLPPFPLRLLTAHAGCGGRERRQARLVGCGARLSPRAPCLAQRQMPLCSIAACSLGRANARGIWLASCSLCRVCLPAGSGAAASLRLCRDVAVWVP